MSNLSWIAERFLQFPLNQNVRCPDDTTNTFTKSVALWSVLLAKSLPFGRTKHTRLYGHQALQA